MHNCTNRQIRTVTSIAHSDGFHNYLNLNLSFHLMPPPSGDAERPSSPEPEVLEGQGSFKLEGWWLKLSQFHGLIVKRFHCAKRNTKGLFSQILLPAFFVCVAMTVALSVPEIGEILHQGLSIGFCHYYYYY